MIRPSSLLTKEFFVVYILLNTKEIEVGGVLGIGGFFVVRGIKRIVLRANEDESETQGESSLQDFCSDDDCNQGIVQNRKFMQKHCLRHGKDPRYALKSMHPENLHDPGTFLSSVVDLVIEFKFLSSVRHPNIIKMRAVSDGDLFCPQAFLVLDKIYCTLTDRIKKWNDKEHSVFHKLFDYHKKREKHILAKRLLVAYDIASALAYLHDMK
jgi:serine/threonine protein kinase